jgi:uncharacterized membrane protein
MIARSFTFNSSMQINAADPLHQMIQSKIYAACLQTRGKQGASRMTTPQAGTSTTNAGTFVTFDVPGAFFTNPAAINNSRAITGSYVDAGFITHSFLRTSDGTITPFDPPGAKCSSTEFFCSLANGITPDGTIVGSYTGTDGFLGSHGYLRAPNGTFTVFDVPGSQGSFANAINPAGAVTGGFFGSTVASHAFLRAPNGTFTTFDPLGSTSTGAGAINPAGMVTGNFIDVTGVSHGFLRTSDGTITAFDPVGSTGTFVAGINPAGTIVGAFFTTDGFVHGFLRASNGTITVFDPPGSGLTVPSAINPAGTIVGHFANSSGVHGFLRASNGTITVFDAPGSIETSLVAINPGGTVTGRSLISFFPPAALGFVVRPKNMH